MKIETRLNLEIKIRIKKLIGFVEGKTSWVLDMFTLGPTAAQATLVFPHGHKGALKKKNSTKLLQILFPTSRRKYWKKIKKWEKLIILWCRYLELSYIVGRMTLFPYLFYSVPFLFLFCFVLFWFVFGHCPWSLDCNRFWCLVRVLFKAFFFGVDGTFGHLLVVMTSEKNLHVSAGVRNYPWEGPSNNELKGRKEILVGRGCYVVWWNWVRT
jgi:hypothetical protein